MTYNNLNYELVLPKRYQGRCFKCAFYEKYPDRCINPDDINKPCTDRENKGKVWKLKK